MKIRAWPCASIEGTRAKGKYLSTRIAELAGGRLEALLAFLAADVDGTADMDSPLVINQHLPPIGPSAKSILFGDFSRYVIRDVEDIVVMRFSDSPFASKNQVGFLAFARADGRLIDASGESIRFLQNSAT